MSTAIIAKQFKEETITAVLNKINEFTKSGGLTLPKDYSAGNSLQAAWLIILETKNLDKKPVLDVCTKESIANALFKMTVMGLNPMKKQCSFIAYGNVLTCQREYQGSIALAKRYGLKSVKANVILKGDEFEFETNGETGRKKIIKHTQTIGSLDGDILGAYAITDLGDGQIDTEIMTMAQIRKAWEQGPTKGNSPAHKNFPDQMCCKTVINRAVKTIINSSDDADLFEDENQETDVTASFVANEVKEHANKEEIGFTESEEVSSSPLPENEPTAEIHDEAPAEEAKEEAPLAEQTGPGF